MTGDSNEYIAISEEPGYLLITLLSHILKTGLLAELARTVVSAKQQRLIITGRNGFFAAGADIAELNALDGPQAFNYARFGQTVLNTIADYTGITMAAVDGYCMGGGLDLALACHIRYATPDSVFAHPGGRIGIMTGWGGTQRLPQLLGRSRALEMMVGGRRLTSTEALEWGLITAVVPDPVKSASLPRLL